MDSLPARLGGLAIAVGALAALVASVLPSGGAPATQKERILEQAKSSGASNVRIRAAEAEMARAAVAPADPTPVILMPAGAEPNVAMPQPNNAMPQPDANAYSGTAPLPQTQFADPAAANGETQGPVIPDEE